MLPLTVNPSQILPPEYSTNGYPFDQNNSPSDDGGNNDAGNEDGNEDQDSIASGKRGLDLEPPRLL
jgi:hypothetical protein